MGIINIQEEAKKYDNYRETVSTLNRLIQGEMVKRVMNGQVKEKILNYFITTNAEMTLIGIRKLIQFNQYKIITWLPINTSQKWIKLRKRKIAYTDVEDLFNSVMMVIDYYDGRIPNSVVITK